MPMPASLSTELFSSPVPAYSVFVEATYVSVPMAFVAKSPETNVQFGDPERAFVVRQIPPPAAPIHTRQLDCEHAGSTAIAVMRPDVTYCAPEKVSRLGICAWLGPTSDHEPPPALPLLFPDFPLSFVHACCALSVSCTGTSSAGYARSA